MRSVAVSVIASLVLATVAAGMPRIAAAAEGDLIDGTAPEALVQVAERYGSARLDRNADGDPLLIGKLDATVYIAEFFGCADGRDCLSIRLRASYAKPGFSDIDMGEWNREERFLKAFLDAAGDPVIHMSVNLVGGVTVANLDAVFSRWTSSMRRFEEFIEWHP